MRLGLASRGVYANARRQAHSALDPVRGSFDNLIAQAGRKLVTLIKRVILQRFSADEGRRNAAIGGSIGNGYNVSVRYVNNGMDVEAVFIHKNTTIAAQRFRVSDQASTNALARAREAGRIRNVMSTFSVKARDPFEPWGTLSASARSFLQAVVRSATRQFEQTPSQLPWARIRGLA